VEFLKAQNVATVRNVGEIECRGSLKPPIQRGDAEKDAELAQEILNPAEKSLKVNT